MITTTFTFNSIDNSCINAFKCMPDTGIPPKGIVQIAHGMAEHAERYLHFAAFLTQNGYIVYANDHRGHGKNIIHKEDMGYFAREHGWFKVVDDMHNLTSIIKNDYPDVPVFILGHSMGSLLIRTYICKFPKAVQGVILSGTAGSQGALHYMAILIVAILKLFKGGRGRAKLLDDMSFGSFNKKIKNPRTKFDWLSKDTSIVDKYIEDPACGGLFTVQFFADLLTGLSFIFNKKNLMRMHKDMPVFFVAGAEDPVGNFGKGVEESFKLFKKAGLRYVELKIFDNMRHEILNEIEKDIVYDAVLEWLNAKNMRPQELNRNI